MRRAKESVSPGKESRFLLIRRERAPVALPLSIVAETMRPQPVQAVSQAPEFVSGVSIVRGEPVPVINLDAMLGDTDVAPTRLLLIRTPHRQLAILTSGRVDLVEIEPASWREIPAITDQFLPDAVRAAAAIDESLAFLLDVARVIPADWRPDHEGTAR